MAEENPSAVDVSQGVDIRITLSDDAIAKAEADPRVKMGKKTKEEVLAEYAIQDALKQREDAYKASAKQELEAFSKNRPDVMERLGAWTGLYARIDNEVSRNWEGIDRNQLLALHKKVGRGNPLDPRETLAAAKSGNFDSDDALRTAAKAFTEEDDELDWEKIGKESPVLARIFREKVVEDAPHPVSREFWGFYQALMGRMNGRSPNALQGAWLIALNSDPQDRGLAADTEEFKLGVLLRNNKVKAGHLLEELRKAFDKDAEFNEVIAEYPLLKNLDPYVAPVAAAKENTPEDTQKLEALKTNFKGVISAYLLNTFRVDLPDLVASREAVAEGYVRAIQNAKTLADVYSYFTQWQKADHQLLTNPLSATKADVEPAATAQGSGSEHATPGEKAPEAQDDNSPVGVLSFNKTFWNKTKDIALKLWPDVTAESLGEKAAALQKEINAALKDEKNPDHAALDACFHSPAVKSYAKNDVENELKDFGKFGPSTIAMVRVMEKYKGKLGGVEPAKAPAAVEAPPPAAPVAPEAPAAVIITPPPAPASTAPAAPAVKVTKIEPPPAGTPATAPVVAPKPAAPLSTASEKVAPPKEYDPKEFYRVSLNGAGNTSEKFVVPDGTTEGENTPLYHGEILYKEKEFYVTKEGIRITASAIPQSKLQQQETPDVVGPFGGTVSTYKFSEEKIKAYKKARLDASQKSTS